MVVWPVCLTQNVGRYLVSGCRAGRQRLRAISQMQQSGPWPKLERARLTCYPIQCSATTELQHPLALFLAVPAVSLAIISTSLRRGRAGRCAAGVRGAGGLGKDAVGQHHATDPSAPAHWLPWHTSLVQKACAVVLGLGGQHGPGLLQPYDSAHSPPLPMIPDVASALTSFRLAPLARVLLEQRRRALPAIQ